MTRIAREPLVHFLLLGAAIFAAYGWLPKRNSAEPGTIVITQGHIEHLATGFARTWQRPPTAEELAGLVRDRVREEVYCREAKALGLDQDDTIIRRRLRQKMEFVSDDIAVQAEPTDADLSDHLQTHADAYRIEPRFTFRQVYLNPERHGDRLSQHAAELLAQLNQAGDKANDSALGDPFLLDHHFAAVPVSEVAKQFGEPFAGELSELPIGHWHGPVASGYGVHLVRISERTQGRAPTLAEVRDAVRRDWDGARRAAANEKFYQELLKRYKVTIERSEPDDAPKNSAVSRAE